MTTNELNNTYFVTLDRNIVITGAYGKHIAFRKGKVIKIHNTDFENLVNKGYFHKYSSGGHGYDDSATIKREDILKIEKLKMVEVKF